MKETISKFISRAALSREPSPIRVISNYLFSLPPSKDVLSLAAGNPAASTFPIDSISVNLKSGKSLKVEGAELSSALQYGRTLGQEGLTQFWSQFISQEISPHPGIDRTTIVTTGAEFGSYLTLNALLNPDDSVLVTQPAYPPMMVKTKAMQVNVVSIPEDPKVGGVCPIQLEECLEKWPSSRPKPKVLMVCPTGSNPSGANIPEEHRQSIYETVCKHDMILLEDDPYYFINYGDRQNSFLHYDREGRVIRLDSLSKVLCPGLRVGFLTAPSHLIPFLERHYAVAIINTSNVAQAIASAYFDEVGIEGLKAHSREISLYYQKQRDSIISALDKHMIDLGSWIVPEAGMFVWIKLKGVEDSSKIATLAMDNGVAFVPGSAFTCDHSKSAHIRLAFSQVPQDRVEEAVIRLASTIRKCL